MTGNTPPPAPYLAPDEGFEALKDATALIRCMAADDGDGIGAIANGTPRPRRLAVMLAAIVVSVCRRGGLGNADIEALLAAVSADVSNFLLDQENTAAEVTPRGRV